MTPDTLQRGLGEGSASPRPCSTPYTPEWNQEGGAVTQSSHPLSREQVDNNISKPVEERSNHIHSQACGHDTSLNDIANIATHLLDKSGATGAGTLLFVIILVVAVAKKASRLNLTSVTTAWTTFVVLVRTVWTDIASAIKTLLDFWEELLQRLERIRRLRSHRRRRAKRAKRAKRDRR